MSEAPILHLVYDDVNDLDLLWVYDENKVLVGQLVIDDVFYQLSTKTIWLGFADVEGISASKQMKFEF